MVLVSGTPDVLVVLPTLGDRLESLERALQSAQPDHSGCATRVVVVVPKRKKKAASLAKKYGAVMVDDPGSGMSAAINRGLEERTDEGYYIWLGDDDYYLPGGLARLRSLLAVQSDAVVAYGGCDYVSTSGSVLWTSRAGGLARWMLGIGPNLIPHPAAMIRWTALEAVGHYDESLSMVMDLDLFLRLKKTGPFVWTKDSVSAFGWHAGSLTVQDRQMSTAEARAVKRKYLPSWLRRLEPLWEYPVAWASRLAAQRLDRRGS